MESKGLDDTLHVQRILIYPFYACPKPLLMTDSICHSSLRRTVLETVALTAITEFCINPRKKVDHVYILVRH